MGEIKRAKCEQCGYSKEFFLGVGMLGGNIDISKKQFTIGIQKEIEQWISAHGYFKSSCTTCLGRCGNCEVLDGFSELLIEGADHEKKLFSAKCPKCGKEYEKIVTDDIKCPICGKGLTMEVTGHWD